MNHSAVSTHAVTDAPSGGLRFRVADLIALVGRFPLSIHQFLFRLAIAGVFLRAGLTKITSWESTVALFADEYKVPALAPHLAAATAASFEVGCSVLLLLGLGTRLAALPLIGMIMTIQLFVYPQAWSEHLVWASILLFLVTRGGGAISLDHIIARRLE
jgi:putative oxidoreductase